MLVEEQVFEGLALLIRNQSIWTLWSRNSTSRYILNRKVYECVLPQNVCEYLK